MPAAASPLLDAFARQAAWCRPLSPFSSRVLERSHAWLQADLEAHAALAALAEDPLAAAVSLRWLAGLHHLALQGLQPWASLWPPNASAASDRSLDDAISCAWQTQNQALRTALARPPQTNEVQRSAALLPGLLHVAAQTGMPLAVLELGASAGLNLWCDHYRHEHGSWAWGDTASLLTLNSDWLGPLPPGATLQIARRAACDTRPVDLTAPGEDLRLASFIWADQPARLARLRAAQQVAKACMIRAGVTVQAAGAADVLRAQLRQRLPGQATVLMHSVMWQYMGAAEQADIQSQMATAGAAADGAAPLAWLRFEPPAPDQRVELRCQFWPGGADRLLATCHPHAARIHWVAT